MTDTTREIDELTFVDYLRPVWRFKFVVILVVAAAAAGAYYYSNRATKVYQTATRLYVGESDIEQLLNPANAGAQTNRFVANQAQLVTTPAIAQAVRTNLKIAAPADALLGAVTATPDANADFLEITAQSSSPRFAANLANGFATAYLQARRTNLVNSAKSALAEARHQLNAAHGTANQPVRSALKQQINSLQADEISPPSPGEQVTAALVPDIPISPKPKRNAIFAGALAFILCVVGAYLIDRSDRRVRRVDEVETLFDLPVLATVPHVRRTTAPSDDPYSTRLALREPHRTLRVNLDLARAEVNAKVIMITSALPSEGKSMIVRNLAISYRESNLRVAVVEADLRRPVLAKTFGVDDGPGLSDALAEGGELRMQRVPSDATDDEDFDGVIEVAVAGAAHENPTVLLTNGRLPTMIARLAGEFDIVLVDSPPLLSVSDGLPVLSIVDGVLVVVRAGTTTHPAATRLRRTVDRVAGAHLLGVVVNDVTDDLAGYPYEMPKSRRAVKPVAKPAVVEHDGRSVSAS